MGTELKTSIRSGDAKLTVEDRNTAVKKLIAGFAQTLLIIPEFVREAARVKTYNLRQGIRFQRGDNIYNFIELNVSSDRDEISKEVVNLSIINVEKKTEELLLLSFENVRDDSWGGNICYAKRNCTPFDIGKQQNNSQLAVWGAEDILKSLIRPSK